MPTILVYNHERNRMERYYRGLSEPMPYVTNRTMTVGEFRSNSNSSILWTDKRMLNAWNIFRRGWGRSIYIGFAFKRIWQGGHAPQSQHYAGVALDTGQNLITSEREKLRRYAVNSGVWSYVEPRSISPGWVHVDSRYGASACLVGGFPRLGIGSKGVYVCVLQDALTTLGFTVSGLDGVFGSRTQRAVREFQLWQGIPATGFVDCNTWIRVSSQANGIGRTPTVIR